MSTYILCVIDNRSYFCMPEYAYIYVYIYIIYYIIYILYKYYDKNIYITLTVNFIIEYVGCYKRIHRPLQYV